MSTFNEANQARLSLKMMLSTYAWFMGTSVESDNDEYIVVATISHVDNSIRKLIPIVHDGVSVKTDVVSK